MCLFSEWCGVRLRPVGSVLVVVEPTSSRELCAVDQCNPRRRCEARPCQGGSQAVCNFGTRFASGDSSMPSCYRCKCHQTFNSGVVRRLLFPPLAVEISSQRVETMVTVVPHVDRRSSVLQFASKRLSWPNRDLQKVGTQAKGSVFGTAAGVQGGPDPYRSSFHKTDRTRHRSSSSRARHLY